ncbi:hypothetical protein [Mesoplasma melaleucae]|uniref:Uncharacterized protein n=1 Tax=Mesoplasma melaleucae TaxID=81459 RepID=A0A2K8NWE2_9MOLU|nr:hypothetical protein [Mesoplasma melaleucae]ATZ18139.1 hypothetical protein EMELA_v1c06310 [Mesoplasma melaleucae]
MKTYDLGIIADTKNQTIIAAFKNIVTDIGTIDKVEVRRSNKLSKALIDVTSQGSNTEGIYYAAFK